MAERIENKDAITLETKERRNRQIQKQRNKQGQHILKGFEKRVLVM